MDLPLTPKENARYIGTYDLGDLEVRVFDISDPLSFVIISPLCARGCSGTDDSNALAPLGVHDHQQAAITDPERAARGMATSSTMLEPASLSKVKNS